MAKYYYLKSLQERKMDVSQMALSVEEKGDDDIYFQLVDFMSNGKPQIRETIEINGVRINRMRIIKNDKKRFLEFSYDFKLKEKKLLVRLLSSRVDYLVRFINDIFIFIKNNSKSVKEYGFRDVIPNQHILSHIRLISYYEKVIKLKTHRLETSFSRVGKDNVFNTFMVIQFWDTDFYFIKLINQFFNKVYDAESGTLKVHLDRETAWSASFPDKIVQDEFTIKRAEFIDYLSKNFSYEEGVKYNLLNLPIDPYNDCIKTDESKT